MHKFIKLTNSNSFLKLRKLKYLYEMFKNVLIFIDVYQKKYKYFFFVISFWQKKIQKTEILIKNNITKKQFNNKKGYQHEDFPCGPPP